MRVLVTGGAGYIGSHAVRSLLIAGHSPIVLDNLVYGHEWIVRDVLKVPLIIGSVGDADLFKSIINGTHNCLKGTIHEANYIEGILHFAAYAYVGESVRNPLKYYKNNVNQTVEMLDTLCNEYLVNSKQKKINIPIVFSSTCATYGIPNDNPITESTPQNPINPYGKSKLIIENVLRDLANAYGLESIILRYFNAAGASPDSKLGEIHQPETHLIPLAIKAAIDNKQTLNVFGNDYNTSDGTCIRDYIHVCDLADAHVLSLEYLQEKNIDGKKICSDFNLGNGTGISVKQIIESVEKVTNLSVSTKSCGRRQGDPDVLIASSAKAQEVLGWEPKFKHIDDIVRHAYLWHQKINHL